MVVLLVAAFLFCGCATLQPTAVPDIYPQLIQQEPLPPWPSSTLEHEVVLEIKIHIGSDGSVKDAVFLTPGLTKEWSAVAMQKIRQWKFSPAIVDGHPVALWIRQALRIRFADAVYFRLAEIVCADPQRADSVYSLLKSGAPFDSLAMVFSIAGTRIHGGYLGNVDLRTYPQYVQEQIQNLAPNQCTSPLLLGQQYVIYKRLRVAPRPTPPS